MEPACSNAAARTRCRVCKPHPSVPPNSILSFWASPDRSQRGWSAVRGRPISFFCQPANSYARDRVIRERSRGGLVYLVARRGQNSDRGRHGIPWLGVFRTRLASNQRCRLIESRAFCTHMVKHDTARHSQIDEPHDAILSVNCPYCGRSLRFIATNLQDEPVYMCSTHGWFVFDERGLESLGDRPR